MTRRTWRVVAAGGFALALSAATTLGIPRTAEPSPGPDTSPLETYDDTRGELGGAELSSSSAPIALSDDEASGENECELTSCEEEAANAPPSPIGEPFLEPYFPFLDDEAIDASASVGDTTHGWVVNAQPLQESEACQILPKQRERNLRWGTIGMIGLVEHTATQVYAQTGMRLWVGNIGKRGGGDIPYSVSHNAGRDADIALAYLDWGGHPVDPTDLVALDATGFSKDKKLHFDSARNWLIVKSLLRYEPTQIQYVFLSEPLKKKILLYARMHREPAEIVAHADDVVHQPSGSHPHNDHMHVRIFCNERDVEAGCNDFGLVHAWTRRFDEARERRIKLAAEHLADGRAEERRRAIERLVLLDAKPELGAIGAALADPEAEVRRTAIDAFARLGGVDQVPPLAERFEAERDPAVKGTLLHAAAHLGGAPAGRLLANVLARDNPFERMAPSALDLPKSIAILASAELASPVSPLVCQGAAQGLWSDDPTLCPAPHDDAPSMIADREILGPVNGADVLRAFAPLADHDGATSIDVLLAAIDAAGQAERLEPVPALLDLLAHADARVRAAAAESLARVTNRRYGLGWDDDSLGAVERSDAIASWRQYARRLRGFGRDAWVASGFVATGFFVPRVDRASVWEIVRALPRRDHVGYNAFRALERIADHHPSDLAYGDQSACSYWLGWFNGHRAKLDLPPAPPRTTRACFH